MIYFTSVSGVTNNDLYNGTTVFYIQISSFSSGCYANMPRQVILHFFKRKYLIIKLFVYEKWDNYDNSKNYNDSIKNLKINCKRCKHYIVLKIT